MTDSNRKRINKHLQSELARVNEAVAAIKKEPRAQELEGLGDNTPLSEDIDAIAVTEEDELRANRLDELLERAAALDEAIHRLEQGVYGRCVACGAELSRVRLSAVPEAARCAQCQSDAERRRPRDEPSAAEWRSVRDVDQQRKEFEKDRFDRRPQGGGN